MNTLSLLRIFFIVTSAHMLLILISIFWAASPPAKMPIQKIAVQTITLQPKSAKITTAPAKHAAVASEEKKEVKSFPKEALSQYTTAAEDKVKTETPKPASQPKNPLPPAPVSKPAASSKKVATAPKKKAKVTAEQEPVKADAKAPETNEKQKKQQELLAKAKESIAKIDLKKEKLQSITSDEPAVKQIIALQSEATTAQVSGTFGVQETSYISDLVFRLKCGLKLPEFGDVTIDLIISKFGIAESVTIVTSASRINAKYAEETIPTILFAPFEGNFGAATKYTFRITLSSKS